MFYQLILIIIISVFLTNSCRAQEMKQISETFGSISEIANLEKARAAHTATRLLDGNVLIVGGMQSNGVFYDEAEIFDSGKNIFTKLENKMTAKRVSHTATLLNDGRVLIVGGWSNRTNPENTAEIFDPKTQKFTAAGNMRFRRSGHSPTLLENGKVLITGGNNGERNLREAELFDPETNAFETIGEMQSPRNSHSATNLKDGKVLITGGEIRRGEIAGNAEIFNPKTKEFTKIFGSLNAVRYKHEAVLLADGSVLIFGGADDRDRGGRLKSAEIFDFEKQTFSPTEDMNFARFKINGAATLLNDGKVLIAGGSKEAEIFNPATKSFFKISGSFGKSLHFASATPLKDGRVLILGGYEFISGGEPTSTNQAWIFKI